MKLQILKQKIFTIIIAIFLLSFSVIAFQGKEEKSGNIYLSQNRNEVKSESITETIGNSKKYSSQALGFSFLFPTELELSERIENGGQAIMLKNSGNQFVLSLFIQIVGDSFELTPDFLRGQIADLVIINPKKIDIDGRATGILFESNLLDTGGKSVEIWFLRAGHLYEVSVPLEYAILGQQIIGTLKFN